MSGTGVVGATQTLADSSLTEAAPGVAGSQANNRFLVSWSAVVDTMTPIVEIQSHKMTLEGELLDTMQSVGGYNADNSDLAAGAMGDFLIVYDDVEASGLTERGIYGSLWGNRIYLPLIVR